MPVSSQVPAQRFLVCPAGFTAFIQRGVLWPCVRYRQGLYRTFQSLLEDTEDPGMVGAAHAVAVSGML